MVKATGFILLMTCICTSGAMAQVQNDKTAANTGFSATAEYALTAPVIDGDLSDAIWQDIIPITNFTQLWPEDGAPPTEDTEVRIAYDQNNLYFAFRFYDRNPELIRAKNLERGGRNNRDDHAYIGIDTYNDGRNA